MTYFKSKAFCIADDCINFQKCEDALNTINISEANIWADRVRLLAPPVKKTNMSKTCDAYHKKES